MGTDARVEPVNILLVEDSPGDIRLTREAFREARVPNNLLVVVDGVDAMKFLRREGAYADAPRPDLILLDLNLPKMDGREVLTSIKEDAELATIPVVVLTTSDAESDIHESYSRRANSYLVKPVDVDSFFSQVRSLEHFWLSAVALP